MLSNSINNAKPAMIVMLWINGMLQCLLSFSEYLLPDLGYGLPHEGRDRPVGNS